MDSPGPAQFSHLAHIGGLYIQVEVHDYCHELLSIDSRSFAPCEFFEDTCDISSSHWSLAIGVQCPYPSHRLIVLQRLSCGDYTGAMLLILACVSDVSS